MLTRFIAAFIIFSSTTAPAFSQAALAQESTITAIKPTPDDRARQWLALIDDENYAQSWSEAAKHFKNRQTADAWAGYATAKRAALGTVTSRDLKSINLNRNNTVVVRYETEFSGGSTALTAGQQPSQPTIATSNAAAADETKKVAVTPLASNDTADTATNHSFHNGVEGVIGDLSVPNPRKVLTHSSCS